MACYIYQLPSWVLDDLCRNMDTLSEWDWMEFASYVITDLTQLRKIKSMERVQGVSITRELLWWWGMRQATVQQLVDLLCHLELYRAAQIILNWKPVPEIRCPIPAFPDCVKPERPLAASVRKTEDEQEEGQPVKMATFPGPGSSPARAHQQDFLQPPEEDAPHSLRTNLPTSSDSKVNPPLSCSPQAISPSISSMSQVWRHMPVVLATREAEDRLSQGVGDQPRCCHPNVLPVLGFCAARQFHSFIYPYMANGSLQDRLQGQGGSDPLPWPQRVSICSGLLCAIEYLHGLEIIHSNVKSSNVLLDQNLTPKLAHPMAHLCPVNKRSKYTVMKTHLFQASVAYLPEDFIRVGQLTKRVDIFSCGIVRAAFLPSFPQKDLLLREIPSSTASLCSRKTGVENVMAKEICQKYLEKGAGRLPEDCAKALATAACLCLRKRNISLQEVSLARSNLAAWACGSTSSGTAPSQRPGAQTRVLATGCGGGRLKLSQENCLNPGGRGCTTETSWQIEINEAKRKLMENILLYKEEKLDSIELFGP
uniref:Interleukin-1 receptor-associated kinase-like 2 n=1 Tax=Rhinopithecus bieti TaxID=61621 RepID=A0A2K6M136_RHIBE